MLPDTRVRDRLLALDQIGTSRPIGEIAREYGCSGFAAESVPLALFAADRVPGKGFELVLRELISAGGDTDTTASLAGQIWGARCGLEGLPEDLVAKLPGMAEVLRMAKAFAEATVK